MKRQKENVIQKPRREAVGLSPADTLTESCSDVCFVFYLAFQYALQFFFVVESRHDVLMGSLMLMFPESVGARDFSFLQCTWFYLPYCL